MERLINIDKSVSTPVYIQIANAITSAIRQGVLPARSALPGTRELAGQLKVHRKTIIAAYGELAAQNWIKIIPRKGVFVAEDLPELLPRQFASNKTIKSYPDKTQYIVDENRIPFKRLFAGEKKWKQVFNPGFPDTRLAPIDLLVREYRRFGNYQFTSRFLMYGPEQGSESLRIELAKFLKETRGLHVSPANILVTKGSQMAMYLVALTLISKGDKVIVGEPGYFGANEVFEHAGATLRYVPVDENGIDVNAVEELCKKNKIRLLYVIPHHHHPTTVTLSPERRMQLLELAMKYNFAILEDDYDYDFYYSSSPILPLASVDYYGNVIYSGSFCKTIAPGIRIGFLVAPENLIEQATRLRRLVDRQGEQLLEEAMANLLKNGDISRHLKKSNKIYRERRDFLSTLLKENLSDEISFKKPVGGMAIWAKYENGLRTAQVSESAASLGLSVSNGKNLYLANEVETSYVRLGFASLNEKEAEEAVELLVKAIRRIRG